MGNVLFSVAEHLAADIDTYQGLGMATQQWIVKRRSAA